MVNSKDKGKRGFSKFSTSDISKVYGNHIKEIWKPVRGFESLYEVSNLGRVKSLPRTTTQGGIMNPHTNSHNGYVYASLSKNGKRKNIRVHKLVIEAFTEHTIGVNNLEVQIDHINGCKTDNRLSNLEVVTQSENMKRAYRSGLEKAEGVKVINLDTKEVFDSYSAASRSIGGKTGEMVARVCRGERSHYRNCHFAKLDDYKNKKVPVYKGKTKKKASKSLWR